MAKYSHDKDYTNQISLNIQRDDFNCPCCGKPYPITEAELEKFELSREFVLQRGFRYLVRYGGYRICRKCLRRRDLTFQIPFAFLKIYAVLAVVTSIIACAIDLDKYGMVTIGFWLAAALPLWILVWLIPNLLWFKASSFRKFDFDKCLSKNAVDWNPRFKNEKK
ncbi:hypothetical protein [Muribaculum intestinale]|uniref:Uncharacterized protein n=1 Tax=Muribaculum intestinale TaxID=1796646 RepID=A0A4S2FYK1_9BACT|nr:hypothetical protein [Muribaculum intestinale]MYM12196.1 hypothetical protein [Muribaculum intestinale]TGY74580.1 hypothetical protein E5333_05860 [Muribaculum intestinale]